jgi:hypothetical protein
MTLEHAASLGSEADRLGWHNWSGWLAETLKDFASRGPATPPATPGVSEFARDASLRVQAHLALLHEAGIALDRAA